MWSGGHGFKYVFLLHPRSTAPLSSVSYCQFSHEYTGGTPTCISFTEGQLLGGLDLAINGKPHTPSLTFDGFSLGRRHDGELRANFLRVCALHRICAFFGNIIQFRPHSPPRHNVKNKPVTVRAMLGEHHPTIPLALCLRHDQNHRSCWCRPRPRTGAASEGKL